MKGWYASSQLISSAFDLFASSILVYFLGWYALIPLAALLPWSLFIFNCRSPKFVKLLQNRVQLERAWLEIMDDAMDNWPLVNAYGLRDEVTGDFKKTCTFEWPEAFVPYVLIALFCKSDRRRQVLQRPSQVAVLSDQLRVAVPLLQ